MKLRFIPLYLLLSLVLLLPAVAPAQVKDQLNLKLERSVSLSEKTSPNSASAPYLPFPHLNEYPYYRNEKQLKEINLAESEQRWQDLDAMLTEYIGNFGVRNFTQDIDLIWKAGQCKEMLQDSSGAQLYYELGIKNQFPYLPRVKLHYDTLIARTHNEWVDLQFYYRILEARRKIDPLIPPKGVMLNMGPKINSDKPDYAPFMHPSDSILVFTSRRDEEIVIDDMAERKNEDLFFSNVDFVSGNWSHAEKFSKSINSQWNEGSACLSPDGRTLIFTRCDAPEGLGSCDLYIAEFSGGDWVNIRNLGPTVNSNSWDSHPNITPDGGTLFFTSNRAGGFGKSDLYVTYRNEDGSWAQAQNLGPVINTIEDEVTPFFHKVNGTLYFSSTGHLQSMGGYDIFKSRFFGDHWESPKNIGPLVNTKGNEYYFSIDGKGTRLFYAMAREEKVAQVNQNFDLYSFPMPMEARPDAIVTLKGYLIDSVSGNPITGIVLVIDRDEGVEVAPKFINEFGYFEFDLMNNKKYDVYIQGENFLTIKENLVVSGDTSFTVFATSFEQGKPLVFESLEFGEDSYELDQSIEPKLDYISSFLKRYPMFRLTVKGHTDSDGEAAYNLDLSRKRAAQIRKYILQRGEFTEARISAEGYGESRPLVANDTEEHKRMNRRVEFEIKLDPDYKGEMLLPAEEEFDVEEMEEIIDPEFNEEEFEFDWEDDTDLDMDWDMDGEDDLREYDDYDPAADDPVVDDEPEE